MEELIIKKAGGGSGGTGFTSNGNGYTYPAVTLNDATGNEVAFTLSYTTNKASSGNDTGLVINQTDTLSPGTSLLQDWQVAGVSKVRVTNAGSIFSSVVGSATVFNLASDSTLSVMGSTVNIVYSSGVWGARFSAGNGLVLQGVAALGFGAGNGAADLYIQREAAYTLAQRFTTNAQTFRIYNTWADTSNYERIAITGSTITVETAGTGADDIDLTLSAAGVGVVNVKGVLGVESTVGITADVGSAQGGSPLTTGMNEVSVCANVGDSTTLPSAVAGISLEVTILNNGANACDVFPASGDDLGAGVDTAASLAAGANITYKSYDATNWFVK